MLPVFQLGPYQLSTYGALSTVILVVCGMYSTHRLFRLPYPSDMILRGLFLTILGGAISTYAMPLLINAVRAAQNGPSFEPEGRSVVWTLAGGMVVAALYCRRHQVSLGRALDLGALPIPLGLAVGRLGCLAAGCCHGRPTDSWLGMRLPDEFGVWMVRYPTQLMCAAANLLTFLALVAAERYGMRRRSEDSVAETWPFNGFLVLLALILYSSKRFVVAFLRESDPPLLGPFTWMHLNALVVCVTSSILMLVHLRRANVRGVGGVPDAVRWGGRRFG